MRLLQHLTQLAAARLRRQRLLLVIVQVRFVGFMAARVGCFQFLAFNHFFFNSADSRRVGRNRSGAGLRSVRPRRSRRPHHPSSSFRLVQTAGNQTATTDRRGAMPTHLPALTAPPPPRRKRQVRQPPWLPLQTHLLPTAVQEPPAPRSHAETPSPAAMGATSRPKLRFFDELFFLQFVGRSFERDQRFEERRRRAATVSSASSGSGSGRARSDSVSPGINPLLGSQSSGTSISVEGLKVDLRAAGASCFGVSAAAGAAVL